MAERVGAPVARGGDRIAEPAADRAYGGRAQGDAHGVDRRRQTPPAPFVRELRAVPDGPLRGRRPFAMFAVPGLLGPHDQFSLPCSLAPEEAAARPVSDDDHSPPWQHVRAELRRAVSDATWHQWLEPLRLRERRDDTLVLEAPDEIRAWVGDHFGRLLQACAAAVLGPEVHVELVAPGAPA